MMDKSNNPAFPLFRKYPGNRSWFVIQSPTAMTEYQQLGSRVLVYEVEAKILPDRVLIQDAMDCKDGRWEVTDAAAFEAWRAQFTTGS